MRSFLFVPGDSERKMAKAEASAADALILDLEDSVAPPAKSAARKLTADYVTERRKTDTRHQLYIRINSLDTPYWQDDLAGVMAAAPDGIILPKPRSGEDVHTLSVALQHAEEATGGRTQPTRIVAIATEVPIAVLQIQSFIGASSRLMGLAWGAEDLSAELGSRTSREHDGQSWTSVYRLARDMTLYAANAGGMLAYDTVFVDFRDGAGLRTECIAAERDGFSGKMAIHPDQIDIINEVFTPSPEAIARAKEIVAIFAANPDAGVASLNGKMLDRPHLRLAERTLSRVQLAQRV